MSYDIYGYTDQEAFDNVQFSVIDEHLTLRRDALRLGRQALRDFPIVKVQSQDREFIQVLYRDTDDTTETGTNPSKTDLLPCNDHRS